MPMTRVAVFDRLVRVAAVAIVVAGTLGLVRSASAQGSAAVTLQGVVYDSVSARTLAGARVVIPSVGRESVTDRAGRFRFDAVPSGARELVVQHDALDALGLFSLRVTAPVERGRRVVVATPSFATMYARLCGQGAPDGQALVFGALERPAGAGATAGDSVTAEWNELVASGTGLAGVRQRRWELTVPVDANGTFVICGAAPDGDLRLAATGRARDSLWSVDTTLEVATQRVRHAVLSPAWRALTAEEQAAEVETAAVASQAAAIAGVDRSVSAVGRGRQLTGFVRRVDGRPVADALVQRPPDVATRTDSTGRFALDVAEGTGSVRITAIGFAPYTLDLAATAVARTEVTVTLEALTVLERVDVTATRRSFRVAGFEERRRQGLGDYRDSTELALAPTLASVLRTMPSVRLSPTGQLLSLSSSCPSPLKIDARLDGLPFPVEELPMLDPRSLAAIEVYRRAVKVPGELMSRISTPCAIWVWTKRAFLP